MNLAFLRERKTVRFTSLGNLSLQYFVRTQVYECTTCTFIQKDNIILNEIRKLL